MEHDAHDHVDQGMARLTSTANERAGQLKSTLADRLSMGAERLRQRTSDTSKFDRAVAVTKERVVDASDRVATRMEHTAAWLRDANMSSIQRGIEKQVKDNPARALAIAAGIGFLLAHAFKRKDS